MSTLLYNEIPDRAFIPVIRRVDIVKARPMNKDEKKEYGRGGPDILLLTPTGEMRAITRKELISNYSYLNGKKIIIAGWSSRNSYTVVKMDNTTLYAMLIPENCGVNIKGREVNEKRNRKDYLLCSTDENGNIDRNSVGILNNKMFKKMFQIPQNSVITKNTGGGNTEFNPNKFRGKKGKQSNKKKMPVQNNKQLDFGLNANEFDNLANEIQEQTPKKVETNMNIIQEKQEVKKLTAIGRIMRNGTLEGFVVQNNQGNTRNVTKQEMMKLCQRKLVNNIMLSTNENTGKYYLRGNGIRIDMLQPYEV